MRRGVEGSASLAASSRTRIEAGSAAIHSRLGATGFTSCGVVSRVAASYAVIGASGIALMRCVRLRFARGLGRTRGRREIDALGGAPEPFEIVVLPGALAENVRDEIAVVEQNPFAARLSFAMRQTDSVGLEPLLNSLADRLNLRLAIARAEQEIFGKRADARQFHHRNG